MIGAPWLLQLCLSTTITALQATESVGILPGVGNAPVAVSAGDADGTAFLGDGASGPFDVGLGDFCASNDEQRVSANASVSDSTA